MKYLSKKFLAVWIDNKNAFKVLARRHMTKIQFDRDVVRGIIYDQIIRPAG
jgi:hypothetical protein